MEVALISALCLFISVPASLGSPAATSRTIVVLGDSISAAYGMSLEEGWVALLARQLEQAQSEYQVINASISGETSAGGAARLPRLLEEHKPAVVILELGGNDGLRGYPVKRLRENLEQITRQSQASGAEVLILGMEIPPNYGSRYASAFRASFVKVAESTGARLSPFMLHGVATNAELMQADGIHPTAQAQPLLLESVWPQLEPLLSQLDLTAQESAGVTAQ